MLVTIPTITMAATYMAGVIMGKFTTAPHFVILSVDNIFDDKSYRKLGNLNSSLPPPETRVALARKGRSWVGCGMNIVDLRPGLQVLHPQFGLGEVKVLTETNAEVLFNEGRKTLAGQQVAELKQAEPRARIEGLEKPLRDLIAEVVGVTAEKLNLIVDREEFTPQLAPKWVGGKVVLHPNDATLATKEIELEIFFRKIVLVRDYLRVLEQKINAHPKLNDAERVELQYYITKSYGSLTTFNLLFKEKEQTF